MSSRYHKETRQISRVSVAGMHLVIDMTWTDADAYLAQRIIGALHSAVNGPAAEAYARVGPWDITTTTTERTNTAAFDDNPVIRLEFACSNLDTEQGA